MRWRILSDFSREAFHPVQIHQMLQKPLISTEKEEPTPLSLYRHKFYTQQQQINSTTMTINKVHTTVICGLLNGRNSLRLPCGSVLTKREDGSIVLLSHAEAETHGLLERIVTQYCVAVAVSRRLCYGFVTCASLLI